MTGENVNGQTDVRGSDASIETSSDVEVEKEIKTNVAESKETDEQKERRLMLADLPNEGSQVFMQRGNGPNRRFCPATVLEKSIFFDSKTSAKTPVLTLWVLDVNKPSGPWLEKQIKEGIRENEWTRDREIAKAAVGYDKRIAHLLA